MANKFSLNVGKTKYSLFHKSSRVDSLPRKLPIWSINNQETKRAAYAKFLQVLLHKIILCKEHVRYIENFAKSIGLIYKVKPFLDKDCVLSLSFSYMHS